MPNSRKRKSKKTGKPVRYNFGRLVAQADNSDFAAAILDKEDRDYADELVRSGVTDSRRLARAAAFDADNEAPPPVLNREQRRFLARNQPWFLDDDTRLEFRREMGLDTDQVSHG